MKKNHPETTQSTIANESEKERVIFSIRGHFRLIFRAKKLNVSHQAQIAKRSSLKMTLSTGEKWTQQKTVEVPLSVATVLYYIVFAFKERL